MIDSSFAQVETFGFKALTDPSRHASSIDLIDLLFGESGRFGASGPGRYAAPTRLCAFTIALRKRSSRPATSCVA